MHDEPTVVLGDPEGAPTGTESRKTMKGTDDLLRNFRAVIAALMRSDAVNRGDVQTALAHLTEVSAQVLRVERASVWRFGRDRRELVCADLYEHFTDRHMSGTVLRAADKPRYFAALGEERSIAAHDARTDPRTSEFANGYLEPLGIASMLDAPILLNGELIGVVCHEHVGSVREWQPWEELAAGSFADFVAMLLGAAAVHEQAAEKENQRKELEQKVAAQRRELEQSHETLRNLFDAAPVALVMTRAKDSTVLAMNRRASAVFGLTTEDAAGRRALDFWVDVADRDRLLTDLKDVGAVDHFEAQLRRGDDGSPFWADLAAQQITFQDETALVFGIQDVTEMRASEERLQELSITDPLTGMLNRRRLLDVAEEELARATRYGRQLSLAMVDADMFRGINEMYGDEAGDEALCSLAENICNFVRRTDVVGRFDGEEFVVLLPETPLEGAAMTLERIRAAIDANPPSHGDRQIPLTVSVGVVEARPDELLPDLLRRAAEALRSAKAAGKNRVFAQ